MTAEGRYLEGHKTHHIIVGFSLENWNGFRQPLAACKHELSEFVCFFFFWVENHSNSISD